MTFHKHRLVPGHMGGTYEASNVIRVNVAMHAFLHKCLWDEHGRWQDRIAWQVLAGRISRNEAIIQATAEAKKQQWTDPAYRTKMVAAQSQSKPGSSAWMKSQWEKGGIRARLQTSQKKRWANPDEHARMSKRVSGKRWALGYKHTPEDLAKISAASKSQWASFSAEKKASILAKRVASRKRNKVVH